MDNTSLYKSLRNFDNKYDLLKLGRPVLFRNEYLEFIHNIITKDEFWGKWLKDNDISLFKQILEPDYMSTYDSSREFDQFCDEEDFFKVRRNTPQTSEDAIKNKELQYHPTEEIMGPGDQYNELSFLLEMFSERFVDLFRHMIEYNIKEEVKIAKEKGEEVSDLLQELTKLEKFETLTKEERSKLYILPELCRKIPSLVVSMHLDLTEPGESIRMEGSNSPKLSPYHYFNAGRAYERAINESFKKYTKQSINRSHSAKKNKSERIEYWGSYIYQQREAYINKGMNKKGKAIQLALQDAVKKYVKENYENYDSRMDTYNKDMAITDKSIKEHIRSNYWHKYKKINNIK